MFDITSSKLLILGIIALIVVGPKELPGLLRTIGKYVSMIRRQANEFKAQFDDAMRETELDKLKKEVEQVGQAAERSISDTERSINDEVAQANAAIETNVAQPVADATAMEPVAAPAPVAVLPYAPDPFAIPPPGLAPQADAAAATTPPTTSQPIKVGA